MLVVFSRLTHEGCPLQWSVDPERNTAELMLAGRVTDAVLVETLFTQWQSEGIAGIKLYSKRLLIDDYKTFSTRHTPQIIHCNTSSSRTSSLKTFFESGPSTPTERPFLTRTKPFLTDVKGKSKYQEKQPTSSATHLQTHKTPEVSINKASLVLSFDAITHKEASDPIWRASGVYKEEMLRNHMETIDHILKFELLNPQRARTYVHLKNMITIFHVQQSIAQLLSISMDHYICPACEDFSAEELTILVKLFQQHIMDTLNKDFNHPPLGFAAIGSMDCNELNLLIKIQNNLRTLGLLEAYQSHLQKLQEQIGKMRIINEEFKSKKTQINADHDQPHYIIEGYERLSTLVNIAHKKAHSSEDTDLIVQTIHDNLRACDQELDTDKVLLNHSRCSEYFIKADTIFSDALHQAAKQLHTKRPKPEKIAEAFTRIILQHHPAKTPVVSQETFSPG